MKNKTKTGKKILAFVSVVIMLISIVLMSASAVCDHDYEIVQEYKAPTCTLPGKLTMVRCKECWGVVYYLNEKGEAIEHGLIEPLGHIDLNCDEICDRCSSWLSVIPGQTGQCGDNVYWNYDSATGKLVISGTGPMYDYVSCFRSSKVKSIIIENGVTSISRQAFEDCKNLESVIIADSVTSIGNWAFYNTGYYNNEDNWNDGLLIIDGWIVDFRTDYVCISADVKSLADEIFYTDIPAIKYFEVDSKNEYFSSDEYGVLYNKEKTELIYYPNASKNVKFVVPETVEKIQTLHSFYLQTLVIPDNVKEIADGSPVSLSFKNVYFYGNDTKINTEYGFCYNWIDQEKWFEVCDEYSELSEKYVEELKNNTLTDEMIEVFSNEFNRLDSYIFLDYHVPYGTIHAPENSTAQAYANERGINFKLLEPHTCVFGEWYTVTEATVFAEGEKRRDCDCGEYETDVIAKLESAKAEDETTGVEITYTGDNFDSKVEIIVSEDAVNANIAFGDNYKNYKAYDISLMADGENVQPEGFVTVKLPLPEEYNPDTTVVYYVADNGEKTLIESKVENGYVIFETDHFSEYVLVDESSKIHKHSYESTTVNPTCTENGVITYTCTCSDIYTETIPATGHKDANGDYKCDYGCGYEYENPAPEVPSDPTDDCTCNCHAGGIKAFFFKILNFFQKLFGKNKVCACGVKH